MNKIKRVKDHRNHSIKNSYGVYDGYDYYIKNICTEKPSVEKTLYSKIIRMINTYLAEELISGNDIIFPNRMGRLELRKVKTKITINDKSEVEAHLPINWNETLKLWYEDQEARKNKTLVKIEEREVYKIYYNVKRANYTNKTFFQFRTNRELKMRLKEKIKNGDIEAFLLTDTK